jgi:hypothetical protein
LPIAQSENSKVAARFELAADCVDPLAHLRRRRDGDTLQRLQRGRSREQGLEAGCRALLDDAGWHERVSRATRGRVLAKVGRPEAVAEKSPHLSRRRAIVVPVDRDRQCDIRMADELPRQDVRTAPTRKRELR